MRFGANQMPEVYFDGKWVPICGHWFWNNNIGANLFCQEFGFESGTLKNTHLTLPNDGLIIGKCEQRDAWLQCSGNCNNLQIGGSFFSRSVSGGLIAAVPTNYIQA